MIKIISKGNCCGCHACSNICPTGCVIMDKDEEGFLYPKIDAAKCINCGLCEKVCPELSPEKSSFLPQAYAAINVDDATRCASSSGGMFTLIAEYVLKNKGIVFGAAFDQDFNLCHKEVTSFEGLEILRGSKYLQSSIGVTYKSAKNKLDAGELVLFSGTPCQINGFKKFLSRDYENLICVDFICHGVPSPLVWQKYVAFRQKTDGGKLKHVNFRLKNQGWKLYEVLFEYSNEFLYRKNLKQDRYMQGFLSDLFLRPSCYQCSFRTEQRVSDFTLADFWGIQNIAPEMDDDKGTSLIIVQSQKGETIFADISRSMRYKAVKLSDAIHSNRSMICSPPLNRKRQQFFKKLADCENVEDLIGAQMKKSLAKRCAGFLKKFAKSFRK